MSRPGKKLFRAFYDALYERYGRQFWWPGETDTEVAVGAILTQNTNWRNVEKALANLKAAGALDFQVLRDIPLGSLKKMIRPSGFFNVKARRLKDFVHWLFDRCDGRLDRLKRWPLETLRRELLGVSGIGPETADSILLYALGKPTFVVDAYTRRFLYRHGLLNGREDYETVRELFMQMLTADVRLFNEYHALIVRLGKDYCRPKPLCDSCPLKAIHYDLRDRCPQCYRSPVDMCLCGGA